MKMSLEEELPLLVAKLRITNAEATSVEVKPSVNRLPRSVPETLSAFANGSGGVIILGLDEHSGFTLARGFRAGDMREALAGACADRLQPPLRPDIQIVPFEGAQVVAAYIDPLPPVERPCFVRDRGMYVGSFIRTGDGDRKLSQYEIDRLMDERRQPRWDEEIVPDATAVDLDASLIDSLVARQRTLRPNLFASGSAEAILQGLHVLHADDRGTLRPTIAGILALGIYPQHFFPRLNVTFASYPGESKASTGDGIDRMLDSASFVGPIPALVRDATSAVIRNARIAGRMNGVFREEVPEYPLAAVREAITNALMHRDYSPLARGTQVQVNLYTNRLEVLNPGGLFGTVTVEKLGSPGLSSARNQWLSTILEEVPYPDGGMVAENRGSGYLLMETILAKENRAALVPEDDIGFFRLTFPGATARPSTPAGTASLVIAEYLSRHGVATTTEIADGTGLSRPTVAKHLHKLVDEGRAAMTQPTRSRFQKYRWIGDSLES